jgi:hypothetical protein
LFWEDFVNGIRTLLSTAACLLISAGCMASGEGECAEGDDACVEENINEQVSKNSPNEDFYRQIYELNGESLSTELAESPRCTALGGGIVEPPEATFEPANFESEAEELRVTVGERLRQLIKIDEYKIRCFWTARANRDDPAPVSCNLLITAKVDGTVVDYDNQTSRKEKRRGICTQ